MNAIPISTTDSDYSTVTSSSQKFSSLLMAQGHQYILTSSVNCYYKVGPNASVTASAADGSHFLAAGRTAFVAREGSNDCVAIIREAVDGVATLSLVKLVY